MLIPELIDRLFRLPESGRRGQRATLRGSGAFYTKIGAPTRNSGSLKAAPRRRPEPSQRSTTGPFLMSHYPDADYLTGAYQPSQFYPDEDYRVAAN